MTIGDSPGWEEEMRTRNLHAIAVASEELKRLDTDEMIRRDKLKRGSGYAALARSECMIATSGRYIDEIDWRRATVEALRWFVFAVDRGYEFDVSELRDFARLGSNATDLIQEMEAQKPRRL